jgi:hypothetical protein
MSEEFEQIKKDFDADAADFHPFFPGDLGAALGILDEVCRGKVNRHRLQFLLTGCQSVKEMNEGQKWALVKFVMPLKVGGRWAAEFPDILQNKVVVILAEPE